MLHLCNKSVDISPSLSIMLHKFLTAWYGMPVFSLMPSNVIPLSLPIDEIIVCIRSILLLSMLPEELRAAYVPYLSVPEDYDRQVVKAADSISAYLKCLEEKRAGNREFDAAGESLRSSLAEIALPEVQDFIREFIPSFELSLDELNQPSGR